MISTFLHFETGLSVEWGLIFSNLHLATRAASRNATIPSYAHSGYHTVKMDRVSSRCHCYQKGCFDKSR